MGDLKRPFKKGRGSTEVIKQVAPIALSFLAPGIGSALKIGATGGAAVAGGLGAAISGNDPLKGALYGAIPEVLANLPGKTGKFFDSPAGRGLMGMFLAQDGDFGQFGNMLGSMGISGGSKDFLEMMLALAALSVFSEKFSKDARERAEAVERDEKTIIDDIITKSKEMMPTEASEEGLYGKSLEEITRSVAVAGEQLEDSLKRAGVWRSGVASAQRANIEKEGMRLRLKAFQEQQLSKPDRIAQALQAEQMALAPLSGMAERARAEEMFKMQLPFDIAGSIYESRATKGEKLYEQLLQQQIDAMRGGAAGGGAVATGGTGEIIQNLLNTYQAGSGATEGIPYTVDPSTGQVEYQYTPGPNDPNYQEIESPSYTPVPEGMFRYADPFINPIVPQKSSRITLKYPQSTLY